MNTNHSLDARVAALEQEVAHLKEQVERKGKSAAVDPWVKLYGAFANDPAFEEAMRYGREWRESFRPKPRRRPKLTKKRKT